MNRKQNFQTIAWFWDQHTRNRLNLDPPYQRRSVWNQPYRDYFIDTLLLGYPAPAIFLYEEIAPDGRTKYHVVDGKQRLTAIFDFARDVFPVSEEAERTELRGLYFRDLEDAVKREFWSYQFSVEYVPTDDDSVINNVFDRINRNTAKLSNQELRHARFEGVFISEAERLAEVMTDRLGERFPNIAPRSRRQMKDVEFTAELLLLLEAGPKGYSTAELDEAFAVRDEDWEPRPGVVDRFKRVVDILAELSVGDDGQALTRTRLRNQADFYSLFGGLDSFLQEGVTVNISEWRTRLTEFARRVDDEDARSGDPGVRGYFEAARSASNDTGPRQTRIRMIERLLRGEPLMAEEDST